MNKAELRKLSDTHTNRLLVSVGISFALMIVLIAVHMAQLNWRYMEASKATLVLSWVFGAGAVVIAAVCAIKKKLYLIEYAGLAVVMAFCFYCVHGVSFVRADLMKYGTGVLVVGYLVGTYLFHTFYPKYVAKKNK